MLNARYKLNTCSPIWEVIFSLVHHKEPKPISSQKTNTRKVFNLTPNGSGVKEDCNKSCVCELQKLENYWLQSWTSPLHTQNPRQLPQFMITCTGWEHVYMKHMLHINFTTDSVFQWWGKQKEKNSMRAVHFTRVCAYRFLITHGF